MRSTPADVQTALRTLRSGFPGEHPDLGGDVVEVWSASLGHLPGQALIAAAVEWVNTEPRFPTLVLFHREAQVQARRLAPAELPPSTTTVCPLCDGTSWVEVDLSGRGTVRPCERCNRAGWARWKAGHHLPGHRCGECDDLRTAKRRPA